MGTHEDAAELESALFHTGNIIGGEEVGHYVVVQMKGHRKNPQLDSVVGVFHDKAGANAYADRDRGLEVIEIETLG